MTIELPEIVPQADFKQLKKRFVETAAQMKKRIGDNETVNLWQWRYNVFFRLGMNRLHLLRVVVRNALINRAVGGYIGSMMTISSESIENEYHGLYEMLSVSLKFQGIFISIEDWDRLNDYCVMAREQASVRRYQQKFTIVGGLLAVSYASYRLYNYNKKAPEEQVAIATTRIVQPSQSTSTSCQTMEITPSATELCPFLEGNPNPRPDNISGNPWQHEVGYVSNSPCLTSSTRDF